MEVSSYNCTATEAQIRMRVVDEQLYAKFDYIFSQFIGSLYKRLEMLLPWAKWAAIERIKKQPYF